jgi:hypothetical protein
MKTKYLLTVIAIVAFTTNSFAQYSQDAIRFSTFQTGSTSRIKGIGNAGTAIGGDLSSLSGNPAGLGFFTHSELSITPEFNGSTIKSIYLGDAANNSYRDSKSSINFNNAAVVIYQRLNTPKGRDKTKGWLSINYGAAYSRTNNFYENITYGAKSNPNSITDYYASLANANGTGNVSNGGLDDWAYQHNLIDSYNITGGGTEFRSNVQGSVAQLNNTIRTGGQSEIDLAFGANYSNKLYLGVGISLSDIRYNSYNIFSETGTASVLDNNNTPQNTGFKSNFIQDQVTKGSGGNIKLGLIYKPVNAVRLGLTVTSPTFYTIDDSYTETLSTQLNNGGNYRNDQNYPLTYNMRTPLKLTGGAAIFIGKYGFISGDVDYIDYKTTHLSTSDDYTADFDNANIKALYRSTINARVGAEARITSMFYLRGGYAIQGSPLKENGSDIKTVSGGLGVRFGQYFIDATFAHLSGSATVYPYEIGAASPSAVLNKTNNNGFLTLGYTF